jgi:ABC-type lipoprotein release transport system permease subunit
MMLSLAWRNLWRNPRRTVISLSALSLGVMAIISIHSYRESAYGQLIADITAGLVGHFQVHGQGYQLEPELSNVVRDPVAVEAALATALPNAKPVRRVLGYGLAGSGEASAAALIMGIQPDREREGTPLLEVKLGRGLTEGAAREAVIGTELAAQLEARPGSELVLVGQAADGSVANDRYTIVGIVDGGSSEMNASAVFLTLKDAQDFFGLGEGVHQVLVRLPTNEEDLSLPEASLRAALDVKTLEVLSWSEMMPELKGMMEQKRKSQHVVDYIVFLIVALGVFNAMTMSTFERTREFGVMASLGSRPRRIVGLVLTESALQGALGLAIGLALALALLYGIGTMTITAVQGSDIMGVRFPPTIVLKLNYAAVGNAALTALLTVVAGGLWPAVRAARLKPAEAARHV